MEEGRRVEKITVGTGIDVSTHNGAVDWEKVKKAGVQFAIVRAGFGNTASQQDAKAFCRRSHKVSGKKGQGSGQMRPAGRKLAQKVGGRAHDDGDRQEVAGRDPLDRGQGNSELLDQLRVNDVHGSFI